MHATAESAAPAIKDHDSPVAVLFATRLASRLLPLAVRSGISPNGLTLLSLGLTAAAAALLGGTNSTAGAIFAAMLIEAGFVIDCLDGQLARSTGRTSDFGAYLDVMTDLVKVFLVVASAAVAAGGATAALCAGWSFFCFALCQHHVHVTRSFPQRSQWSYERDVVPWKRHLVAFGQRVDLAFAVGEVLAVMAIGVLVRRPFEALLVLAVLLPIQFASYSIRFWRHRYAPGGADHAGGR